MNEMSPPPPGAGPQGYTLVLAADPASVGLARRVAEGALRYWGHGERADDAALVVTELAANAVAETPEGAFWTRTSVRPDGVLLEVWDAAPQFPPEGAELPAPEQECGRGLFVVDALSAKHGVEAVETGGKVVWSLLT